jgi:hypothetical protein
MTTIDLTNTGMKMTYEYSTTVYPELSQMGMHTGMRESTEWGDVLDYMESEVPRFDTWMPESTFTRLVLSQWTTAGFVGWHQIASRDVSIEVGTAAVGEPHQLSISVQVTNTVDLEVPVGRRRNRTFLGPLVQGLVDGDTRLGATEAATLAVDWVALDGDLRGIPCADPPGDDFAGLCVVSPTGDLLLTGDEIVVGRRFDVHRSRAEHTAENPVRADFP